jgi:hypothetical protein
VRALSMPPAITHRSSHRLADRVEVTLEHATV